VDAYTDTNVVVNYDDNGTPKNLAALGPISNWCTSGIKDMNNLFYFKTTFNDPLYWDTSSVTNMNSMFMGAFAFNQPSVVLWDVSKVTDMQYFVNRATVFAQNMCPWKDAPALAADNDSSPYNDGDYYMFAESFGQPLSTSDGYFGFDASQCVSFDRKVFGSLFSYSIFAIKLIALLFTTFIF